MVPAKAVKAAGGTGPCSMTRPLQGRSGDCGDTNNPTQAPGAATGAVPASQEGAELPGVRAVRQALPRRRPGARLRPSEGEWWCSWGRRDEPGGHRSAGKRSAAAGTEGGTEDEDVSTRPGPKGGNPE